MRKRTGFTIVELLIVIVIIAVLAAMTVAGWSGVQDRAKASKAKADVAQLAKAMHAAKLSTGLSLIEVTASLGVNSTGSGRGCWSKASGTDLAALPKTDACWTDYFATLQILSDASGINVTGLLDPWNRPYYIDQSEGENVGGNYCVRDKAGTYRLPFVNGSANDDPEYRILVPHTTPGC